MRVAHTAIADKLGANAEAIKRWERKATRAMNALARLRKQRARLERLMAKGRLGAAVAKTIMQELNGCAIESSKPKSTSMPLSTGDPLVSGEVEPRPKQDSPPSGDDGLAIPGFLRRSKEDQEAIDRAKTEREEQQRAKAKAQANTRKARRSGETKRMPLTGKAALAAIRAG